MILEVPSNLAFCDSDIFASGRCGQAIKYLTAMYGKLTHQSTSQKASQKLRLIQKCPWMAPPHCCSQSVLHHVLMNPAWWWQRLMLTEKANPLPKPRKPTENSSSEISCSHTFGRLHISGTAWIVSGGSQGLELEFSIPIWMDFYIPTAAFIQGSSCKAEVTHTAEQTAHSSFIWRGFVQPGFTLPAKTRCLAPPRYSTIHLAVTQAIISDAKKSTIKYQGDCVRYQV